MDCRNQHMIIRADATSEIGIGHVMRCLAIAQRWREEGGKVRLIGRIASPSLRRRLSEEGVGYVSLTEVTPDKTDLKRVVAAVSEELQSGSNVWVVLDGYHFDQSYQQALADAGARLLIIDDYGHLPGYSGDILLNQNSGAASIRYNINPGAAILRGSSFALLRDEFLQAGHRYRVRREARKILVCMGGADPRGVTSLVLDGIGLLRQPELEVRVVVGQANCNRDKIIESAKGLPHRVSVHEAVDNMVEMYAWADLVVCAAGSSCWEMAYLGVPFLMVVVADNQVGIAEDLEARRVAKNLGWYHGLNRENIARSIESVLGDDLLRKQMSTRGRKLVDGRGRERVFAYMEAV